MLPTILVDTLKGYRSIDVSRADHIHYHTGTLPVRVDRGLRGTPSSMVIMNRVNGDLSLIHI